MCGRASSAVIHAAWFPCVAPVFPSGFQTCVQTGSDVDPQWTAALNKLTLKRLLAQAKTRSAHTGTGSLVDDRYR